MSRRNGQLDAALDALIAVLPETVGRPVEDQAPELAAFRKDLSLDNLGPLADPNRLLEFGETLERTGFCAHPVSLRGSTMSVDAVTGEVLSSYSSSQERDGLTRISCGTRFEWKCPWCSRRYASDTYHLIRAGVIGGKGVPQSIVDNPLVFATLTAPSFGAVHGRYGGADICHPRAHGSCPHGVSRACRVRHGEDEEILGQPICPDCYDYESQIIWQWWAPDLWRRFTVRLRRLVARELGVPGRRLPEVATLQYVKVTEEQRRGAIHFHVLVRLDGSKCPEGFAPAPAAVTPEMLARLIEEAGHDVCLVVPGVDEHDSDRRLVFGRQLDTRIVTARQRTDDPADELDGSQVAGYLAKYATKSVGDDPRVRQNNHRRQLRNTTWRLSSRARTADADVIEATDRSYRYLGRRATSLGFRGQFCTKSRRFSSTMTALRRSRSRARIRLAEHARLHPDGPPIDLAALEDELLHDVDDETTVVLGQWEYVGSGWSSPQEKTLALAAAARARQYDKERAQERAELRKQRAS